MSPTPQMLDQTWKIEGTYQTTKWKILCAVLKTLDIHIEDEINVIKVFQGNKLKAKISLQEN